MTRKEVVKRFTDYLKSHGIKYQEDIDNGSFRITMVYRDMESCPDYVVESCIWFDEECMEVRVYYSQRGAEICRDSTHRPELYRLLNFINARVWVGCSDGMGGQLYAAGHSLFTPRLYVTEDEAYDITLTMVIDYDVYAMAPLETEDYVTGACPELLNQLSHPVFGILLGTWSVEEAIKYIEETILGAVEE